MAPGEVFLTVFVAFLAGATVYLGFTVRDLQQRMQTKLSYTPLPADPECEAHEATKARTAQLQAAKLAMPERDAWPYEWSTDPGLDPATTMPTSPPGRHADS